MWFTKVQDFIFKLLKTYRCLRDDQIEKLAQLEFGNGHFCGKQLQRMLIFMPHMLYRPQDGYAGMTQAVPDGDTLIAVDVMLEFMDTGLEAYRPGKPPFKLVFFKNSKDGMLRAFYVTIVRKGTEYLVSQQAQAAYKGDKNAVIFVLEDLSQAAAIRFPYEHYFAIAGNHRYGFFEGVVSDSE